MDGVMVDSEVLWGEIEQEFFSRHGIEYHDQFKQYVMGKTQPQVAVFYKKEFNLPQSVEEIIKERVKLLKTIFHKKLKPNPGLEQAITYCQDKGLKLSVASASPRQLIEFVLKIIQMDAVFPVIVSGDEVEYGKPKPDIFLLAAERLEVPPAACIVIEDSQNGLQAAHAAGMRCIAMPDLRFSERTQFVSAEAVVKSLLEIPAYLAML
ncbi:hypothetical protein A3B21_01730 [Candidatus Uhrbacteria bacterium RIFCSPLOWO2_01_FULL_47_24]|uniref:Uncharacterized protein n=1 Tax=Candidatus Uhrbacteria bacterium RIFCSPLOWO2_01_FULL_47_24 TaxID=1802401 RepID=A0A1F7UQS1_9BACT|nr:MAG: hypothetical protein A2753_04255 [Candidatus Uhrbacteria bacterium RIFCSPHIGHO2_01_FULL_47_11]OGL67888.1 MAG: hypothetical protein A3D58_04925 [Candidatus Uhrbacteria bacterium RIFCSPHIGHO2_02_FULL_46_47]OGL75339.1 MAG: hypothetical protein A3F52_03115 [Candidatus Uhrbacteria bacterium RIFCSPHIGHO2_12_FULL_47_11]OGL80074.1 MAG: hypothetical protein A3B21_01730 [Candidatus Uhrbacteria bacterium RIFCSPLOWO2_01_FULL_47_24]